VGLRKGGREKSEGDGRRKKKGEEKERASYS